MNFQSNKHVAVTRKESGFVLPTSLLLLTLLSMLATTMYYVSRSSILTSSSAHKSTSASYYAETAINYMEWSLINDAEFDSYTGYTGAYDISGFLEAFLPPNPDPAITTTATEVGDRSELDAYRWFPGPTVISDINEGTLGQVRYFDNSPMSNRFICMESASTFSNCIDVTKKPSKRVEPVMHNISANLPRYIKLEIAANGAITPSIPQLPHHATPIVGQDIPKNGAIVWLTAVDPANISHDIEIFPLDPNTGSIYTGFSQPSACVSVPPSASTPLSCPCDGANVPPSAQACDAHSHQWLSNYGVVAYAIGYVNGKPSHLLRAVIM